MWEDQADEAIIRRIQELFSNGDEKSLEGQKLFKLITNRYYQQAYNFCRYYGLSHHDSKDTMQDAFIKLYKYAQSFDSSKKFKPWFFKLLFHKIQDKRTELKSKRHQDIDDYQDSLPQEKNFSEEFQNRDYWTGIINELPDKLKKVLVLYIFNGLTYEEIADAVGVTSRQVRNQLDTAIEELRRRAGGQNGTE